MYSLLQEMSPWHRVLCVYKVQRDAQNAARHNNVSVIMCFCYARGV
jgi:hypothetical protein